MAGIVGKGGKARDPCSRAGKRRAAGEKEQLVDLSHILENRVAMSHWTLT